MLHWFVGLMVVLSASAAAADIEPVPEAQVLSLPAGLVQRFHHDVLAQARTPAERLDRLVAFVFEPQGLGMQYAYDATHTVEESYVTRKSNCLGFTLLFLALAREAGIEAQPQEIAETLNWQQDNATLYLSNHVNVRVRVGARRYTLDAARDTVITRRPPQVISEQRLLAHFYNNLAMDQMQRGDNSAAESLLQRALALDSGVASFWNNAGVLHLRQGQMRAAETSYQHALELDADASGALFNLASLSHDQGDSVGEARYQRRLARSQEANPFHQFLLATQFEQAGDHPQAIAHYRSAIRNFAGEPRFYAALAQAYLHNGEMVRAANAFDRAAALSKGAARDHYRAQREAALKQGG